MAMAFSVRFCFVVGSGCQWDHAASALLDPRDRMDLAAVAQLLRCAHVARGDGGFLDPVISACNLLSPSYSAGVDRQ
jgi:hypothetical protein